MTEHYRTQDLQDTSKAHCGPFTFDCDMARNFGWSEETITKAVNAMIDLMLLFRYASHWRLQPRYITRLEKH